jgi:hypothetical protein
LALVALSVVEQRYRAVTAVLDGARVSEVAVEVGVSRQSVHAWLARYREAGLAGLAERSHRTLSCPHRASAELEALVCELRRVHPRWGAQRIVYELMRGPAVLEPLPARATVHRIPTGERAAVAGTAYDFATPRPIGATQLDIVFGDVARQGRGRATVRLRAPDGAGVDRWLAEHHRYLMLFTGDTLSQPERRRRSLAVEPMTCAPRRLPQWRWVVDTRARRVAHVCVGHPHRLTATATPRRPLRAARVAAGGSCCEGRQRWRRARGTSRVRTRLRRWSRPSSRCRACGTAWSTGRGFAGCSTPAATRR